MHVVWKPVEMILPEQLPPREVQARMESQIRINASEAGEFVKAIRLGRGHHHSAGHRKWSASYLPGPAAAFPVVEHELQGDPAHRQNGPSDIAGTGSADMEKIR